MAQPFTAKMDLDNAAIVITFSDFAEASGFESYECVVSFDTWEYKLEAEKVTVNYQDMYRRVDQGILHSNTFYDVWFTFEDRPYERVVASPLFRLSTSQ
jgi:hypothetical protein